MLVTCTSKVILQLSLLAGNKSAEHLKITPGFINAMDIGDTPVQLSSILKQLEHPNEIKATFVFIKQWHDQGNYYRR